jgi:hypothetical protein
LCGCERSHNCASWQSEVDPRSLCRKTKRPIDVATLKLDTRELGSHIGLLMKGDIALPVGDVALPIRHPSET